MTTGQSQTDEETRVIGLKALEELLDGRFAKIVLSTTAYMLQILHLQLVVAIMHVYTP